MIEPEFSEGQLQQLVNTDITMRLYSERGDLFLPAIISTIKEFDLGWDSAYFFPWLATPPNPKHKGCNLFIQFKRSKMIEGSSGGEWVFWREPYLRFQIPYSSKDRRGNYRDNYNQFDRLKELADEGYDVFYVTNHVLSDRALFDLANRKKLVDETPFLEVSDIDGYHKKATFTEDSQFFYLHSEPNDIKRSTWENIFSGLQQKKGTSLSRDVHFIEKLLMNFEEVSVTENGGFHEEITRVDRGPSELKVLAKGLVLSKYLRRFLDLYWFRTVTE